MKKIILALSLALSLIIVSCSEESIAYNDVPQANASLVTAINELKVGNSTMSRGSRFDLDNIKETYEKDALGIQVFTAYEFGYDESNAVKTVLQIVMQDEVVVDEFVVQTNEVSTALRTVSFMETDFTEFGAIEFDLNNQQLHVVTNKPRKKPCGQRVMDCIQDVYSNHGWVSVWAWVQTAYIPATAVGIAAACWDRACP